jgi:hypothetical protein
MMLGGLFVMMCCFVVVFVDFWHLYLPVDRSSTNLRLGTMEQRGSTSVSPETFPDQSGFQIVIRKIEVVCSLREEPSINKTRPGPMVRTLDAAGTRPIFLLIGTQRGWEKFN